MTTSERVQDSVLEYVLDVAAELLGTRPAPSDNFFTAGGHSLLALQLRAQLEREGIDVSLADIVGAATIADIAEACCDSTSAVVASRTLHGLLYSPTAQERSLGLLEDLGLEPFDPGFVFGAAYLLADGVPVDRLEACLQGVVDHHPPLHTFLTHDDYGVLVRADLDDSQLKLLRTFDARLGGRPTADTVADVAADALAGLLDAGIFLGDGPPLRVELIEGAAARVVVVAVHHTAVDGEGLAGLIREVELRLAGTDEGTSDWQSAVATAYARIGATDQARPSTDETRRHWAQLLSGVETPQYRGYGGRGPRGTARTTTQPVAAAAIEPILAGRVATSQSAWTAVVAFAVNHRLLERPVDALILPTFSSLRDEHRGVRPLGFSLDIVPLVVPTGEQDDLLSAAGAVRAQTEAWLRGHQASLADLSVHIDEVNRLMFDPSFPLAVFQVVYWDRGTGASLATIDLGTRVDRFKPVFPLDALVSVGIARSGSVVSSTAADDAFGPSWSAELGDAVHRLADALCADASLARAPYRDLVRHLAR